MSICASIPPYSTWKCGGGCSRKRIRTIMPLNLQSSGTGRKRPTLFVEIDCGFC